MKKQDLVKALVEQEYFTTQKEAGQCIDLITNTIAETVAAGETVELFGFGKFEAALQKGKTGEVAGKKYTTKDKMVPKFRTAKAFKDLVAAGTKA